MVLVLSKNAGLLAHVAHRLVYFVMYAIVPLPLLLLQQLAPAFTLKYKLQPRVKQPSPIAILQYMRDNTRLALFIIGPFPAIYSAAFKGLYTANLFVKFTKPSRHCKLNKHLNIDNRNNLKCSTISCHYTRLALA